MLRRQVEENFMRKIPILTAVWVAAAVAMLWGQTQVDLRTQSKSVDFSAAGVTKPMSAGTVLPASCTAGQMYFLESAPLGANIYGCTSANVWTAQASPSSGGVPAVAGNAGDVLTTDGTNVLWTPMGGDVTGAPGATKVIRLQGQPVSSTAPAAGQALIWSGAAGQWQPQSLPSGGGPILASQLLDFAITETSATTLTMGQSCSAPTPCNFRFGSDTYTLAAPASVTLNGGSGTVYVYLMSNGTLAVGSTLSLTCTAVCAVQSGVTGFPPGTIPLYTVTATNGAWNASGITDYRAFLSSKSVGAGTGILSVDSGGAAMVSVDGTVVPLKVATPATSTTACTTNNWATDGTYFYLCVTTNTWMRVALTSW
jgi:hypothetical protein